MTFSLKNYCNNNERMNEYLIKWKNHSNNGPMLHVAVKLYRLSFEHTTNKLMVVYLRCGYDNNLTVECVEMENSFMRKTIQCDSVIVHTFKSRNYFLMVQQIFLVNYYFSMVLPSTRTLFTLQSQLKDFKDVYHILS